MKKILALSVILLLCLSCKTAVKASYGIHQPRLEESKSVKEYLLKQKIDTANVFVFKNFYAFAMASKMKILIVPDAMFFNSKGYLMQYKEEAKACNANVDKFIIDLQSTSEKDFSQGRRMEDLMTMITSTSNNEVKEDGINVFITWAKFAGKLNKKKAFEWIDLLEKVKKKGVNVNYYLLNCDYQKSWDIPEEVKDKLGIKS